MTGPEFIESVVEERRRLARTAGAVSVAITAVQLSELGLFVLVGVVAAKASPVLSLALVGFSLLLVPLLRCRVGALALRERGVLRRLEPAARADLLSAGPRCAGVLAVLAMRQGGDVSRFQLLKVVESCKSGHVPGGWV